MQVDVLVNGAGQAGLAAGFHLAHSSLRYLILDRTTRMGDSWRARYDTLTLFTPRRFSALPGLDLGGDADGYPSRDEIAAYLERYAKRWQLALRLGNGVSKLTKNNESPFEALLDDGTRIIARSVILATGAFQEAVVPPLAELFGDVVIPTTHAAYCNSQSVPSGKFLVVGDGASGRDIASELSSTHSVTLARGRPRKLFAERVLGRSTWWLKSLGLMSVSARSLAGRLMRRADPFPDRHRNDIALRKRGITLAPRIVDASGNSAIFADGTRSEVNAIVWCVGYKDATSWLDIPAAKDSEGRFLQDRGRTPVPALFHLGRPWQRTRSSAPVMGVVDDAAAVRDVIGDAS